MTCASTATGSSESVDDAKTSLCGPEGSISSYLASHPEASCVVGIFGKWYDVTAFRKRHPGGAFLLEQCHGKDASELFKSFHSRDVLKGWRPIGTYEPQLPKEKKAVQVFHDLHDAFEREGFFETSFTWYAVKVLLTFLFLTGAILVLKIPQQVTLMYAALAGLLLGMFWQQCGFFMHDFMHAELTKRPSIDRWIGHVFGSFCLGISAHWWRDEHFEHHVFCNTIDPDTLYVDPQMQEDVWVQHPALFPLYIEPKSWMSRRLQRLMIRYQHATWVPICVILGRLAIIINGLYKERRWYEIVAQIAHSLTVYWLLKTFIPESVLLRIVTYTIGAAYEGILHMQLLVSHYSKPWFKMSDLLRTLSWYELQVKSNLNIKNPWWLDWFHGGLNFHIEHHLYPLMPRHRFREASFRVRKACEEADLLYDECPLSEAILRTLKQLYTVAKLYVALIAKMKIE